MASGEILVVEDDEICREVVRSSLEKAGYRVATAADGLEAGRALADQEFALVITDLIMPDKDGIEVIGELRAKRSKTPVIAMSGGGEMARADYLKMAHLLGAGEVLAKPFSDKELLAAVKRQMDAGKA